MNIQYKSAKIGIAFWMAFYLLLALVLIYITYKAGWLSNQTFAAIKEKIFPFG